MGKFDAILLRNVLPGLDPSVHGRVIESLAARLEDDGVLLVGNGESLEGVTGAVQAVSGRSGLFTRAAA
jgi:chemotaxis protein methyltransferase CheR